MRDSILSVTRRSERSDPARGFTLIELVVVMTMLVAVLLTAYQILNNSLRTETYVERVTLPEKAGEAIIALMRRDLAGTFYRGLVEQFDREVFMGVDAAGGEGPLDEVHFVTTAEPTVVQATNSYEADLENIRSVTAVSYRLQPNPAIEKYSAYKLYRKEVSDFSMSNPLDSPGLNLEIYDKVKSLSIEYYDGYEWLSEWNSVLQIEAQEDFVMDGLDMLPDGVPRVSDQSAGRGEERGRAGRRERRGPDARRGGRSTDDSEDDGFGRPEEMALPPAAIPTAVRLSVEVYSGVGNRIYEFGDLPIVRRFSTVVSLFAAQRILMKLGSGALDESMSAGVPGVGGGTDDEAGGSTTDRSRSGRSSGGRDGRTTRSLRGAR